LSCSSGIPSGRDSYTEFKLIETKQLDFEKKKEELSLIRVFPKTGRTHQIRVHMQYAGHPIFADSLYAGRKTYASDKKYLKRHFLHAAKIQFTDPDTSAVVTFEAPLTPDLVAFLAQLA
jgi:23S rRNA-/tRNA-specific pseudouridylate synthase